MSSDLGFFANPVSFSGKNAIVTGGSRGIGRAIALELARKGCNLLINYNSNRDAAIEVQRLIHQMGRRSEIIQADVGKISDHEKLVQYTVETLGSVDILINNAGITRVSDILAEKVVDYDIVMNTNLRCPHFLTQRVANYMIDHSIRGAIVFTLSISSQVASDNRAAYCISKSGLEMSMRTFAGRLAEEGIKVNGVDAGVTDTDLARVRVPDYVEAADKGYIFMYRPGQPEDVAQATIAALTLYDTGVLIPCSGGIRTPLLNLRSMTELSGNQS